MKYVSQEDYKKFLENFQSGTKKGKLMEQVEEGNKFTKGLAQTPKGGSFKMNGQSIKDTSGYDSVKKEYRHDDMYPNDPGPFEGNRMDEDDDVYDEKVADEIESYIVSGEAQKDGLEIGADEVQDVIDFYATGRAVDTENMMYKAMKQKDSIEPYHVAASAVEEYIKKKVQEISFKAPKNRADLDYDPQNAAMFKPDYLTPGDDDDDDDDFELKIDDTESDYEELPKHFRKFVAKDKDRIGLRESSGLSALSQTERDQLKEYIQTYKTIKEEIKKLVGKAKGGGMMNEDMGGDRTNMTMPFEDAVGQRVAGTEEEADARATRIQSIERKIDPTLYDEFVEALKGISDGLTPGELALFIKHEQEEIAKQANLGQWDPH